MPTYEDSNVQQHVAESKETKTVDVSVFWRWEDSTQIEVPADMDLDEVRDMIVWDNDFDENSACLVEFDVSYITDNNGDEWSL